MIYYDERTHSKQKAHVVKYKKARASFRASSPSGVPWDVLYPSTMSHDDTWKALSTGKLFGDSVPQVFIGLWWCRHPVCPTHAKSQTPRQKADIQHNPHCLYAQHRHADPLFSVQVIETPKIQVSRWQSRVHLRRPFKVEWVDLSWEPFSAYHINAEGPGVQQNGRRRVGWEEEWWRLREERMTGDKPLSTIQGIILPQTCYSQFIDERTGAGRS